MGKKKIPPLAGKITLNKIAPSNAIQQNKRRLASEDL